MKRIERYFNRDYSKINEERFETKLQEGISDITKGYQLCQHLEFVRECDATPIY